MSKKTPSPTAPDGGTIQTVEISNPNSALRTPHSDESASAPALPSSPGAWLQNIIIADSDRTAGQTGIRKPLLQSLWAALPPVPEQHRIVAKVEALMALCDRLEAQLTTTQTQSRRLLESTLHQLLSSQ